MQQLDNEYRSRMMHITG